VPRIVQINDKIRRWIVVKKTVKTCHKHLVINMISSFTQIGDWIALVKVNKVDGRWAYHACINNRFILYCFQDEKQRLETSFVR